MEQEKRIQLVEKIKSVCIGFIGAGIFSQGILYFQEQTHYNVPRILYPVFALFGNVGLAIGMVLVGLGLIYVGFKKWKKANGSVQVYRMAGVASIILFAVLLYYTNKPKDRQASEDYLEEVENERNAAIDKIKEMDKPEFHSVEIEQYLAEYDTLHTYYLKNIETKNDTAIEKSNRDFANWSMRMSDYYVYLKENEQKSQFAMYVGKLSLKWQAKE